MKELFRRIANNISQATGSAYAFVGAFSIIIIWALMGPIFNYSDTWQLVINTSTTIITFLMVFLIQNTQNRDSKAMQLKLDELIRSTKNASDTFVDLEEVSDSDIESLEEEFRRLHKDYENNPQHVIHELHNKISSEHKRRRNTL